jgi:MFS family permease
MTRETAGRLAGQEAETAAVPAARQLRQRSGFWAAAFAFLVVMAVATLPSPLYGLYRIRDHLCALTITVVFAIFAASTIAILLRDSAIAARIGRRGTMLASVATMMVAMGVLAAWKDLPGLLIGRLITGVSVGLAAGTAITYLIELRLHANPKASATGARTIGTSVTVGALGIGPLIGGCLAQWVSEPLTVPYLVFIALGVVALIGLWAAPETGVPTRSATANSRPVGPRRKVRLPVPAAAATLAAFSANGLFAGLSGLFLATTLHRPSHALSGVALFLVFASGVVSQLATTRQRAVSR